MTQQSVKERTIPITMMTKIAAVTAPVCVMEVKLNGGICDGSNFFVNEVNALRRICQINI